MTANFRWKVTSPPTIVGVRKLRVFGLPHSEDGMKTAVPEQNGQTLQTDSGIAVAISHLAPCAVARKNSRKTADCLLKCVISYRLFVSFTENCSMFVLKIFSNLLEIKIHFAVV